MAITLGVSGFFLMNPQSAADFSGFLWAMLIMFFFAGIGNAGTFKQMPMIMPKRQAGGAIGFTASVAALGPFLVGAGLAVIPAAQFFFGATVYCIFCSVRCWVLYARNNAPFPGWTAPSGGNKQ